MTATLKCLMAFFRVTSADLPTELQPQFVLDVEVAELRIAAGLQDRVVQVYEGLVYMDFEEQGMKERGFGVYERLPLPADLPALYLSYLGDPSDSGVIHSNVRKRFDDGDEVKELLQYYLVIVDCVAHCRKTFCLHRT